MSIKIFVTGTDTDAGKTYISTSLLTAYKEAGYSTLGIKPVASGCVRNNNILQNADALVLQEASSIKLDYHHINPITIEAPIAPHLHGDISVQSLKEKTQFAFHYPADICLIEGVGGWYVPLNDHETMADYVKAIDCKVILVVGMRLGCLNHAILTYQAIKQNHIPIAGWIANCIDPTMQALDENIETLKKWLKVPCVSVVKYGSKLISIDNIIELISLS